MRAVGMQRPAWLALGLILCLIMQSEGGYSVLCPFGNGKIMLVDGLRAGERDKTEDEFDLSPVIETGDSEDADPESVQNQPDINGLAATTELEILENKNLVPYISINLNNPSAKMVHKSSVLHLLSNLLTFTESHDRLMCGYIHDIMRAPILKLLNHLLHQFQGMTTVFTFKTLP
jgi:hypothetical protein